MVKPLFWVCYSEETVVLGEEEVSEPFFFLVSKSMTELGFSLLALIC